MHINYQITVQLHFFVLGFFFFFFIFVLFFFFFFFDFWLVRATASQSQTESIHNFSSPCFPVLRCCVDCVLRINSPVQIGCALRINIFQFKSFCVLHSKSLFLFFEFTFFRSYFLDCVFFFLRICFLCSLDTSRV